MSKEGVGESALKLPFPANNKGAVRTDATLRVVDHPRVFALGDVSGCDCEASTSAPTLAPTAQARRCWTLLCTTLQRTADCCFQINREGMLCCHYSSIGL